MRNYTGKKPCSGCGKTGEEQIRWSVDSLCRPCKEIMKAGKLALQEKENDEDEFVSISVPMYSVGSFKLFEKIKGVASRMLDKTSEYQSGFSYVSDLDIKEGSSKNVGVALRELFGLLQVTNREADNLAITSNEGHYYFVLPKNTAMAFFNLWKEIEAHERFLTKQSYNDGKNLLVGLASGSMTMNEFNQS